MRNIIILAFSVFFVAACSKVEQSDITRACTNVGATPKLMAKQKFLEEYYKLEDIAGKKGEKSAAAINLTYTAMEVSGNVFGNFQEKCEENLSDIFLKTDSP